MNDETNDVLDNFCSGSYEARQFQLESEGVDAPLGRGRIRRLVRGKPKRYSSAEIKKRTKRLAEARKKRWAKR